VLWREGLAVSPRGLHVSAAKYRPGARTASRRREDRAATRTHRREDRIAPPRGRTAPHHARTVPQRTIPNRVHENNAGPAACARRPASVQQHELEVTLS